MEKPTRKPSWKRKLKYLATSSPTLTGLPRRLYSPQHPSGLEAIGRDFDGTGQVWNKKHGLKIK